MAIAQRVLAARSLQHARAACLLAAFLKITPVLRQLAQSPMLGPPDVGPSGPLSQISTCNARITSDCGNFQCLSPVNIATTLKLAPHQQVFILCYPGIIGRALFGDCVAGENSNKTFPTLIVRLLPPVRV